MPFRSIEKEAQKQVNYKPSTLKFELFSEDYLTRKLKSYSTLPQYSYENLNMPNADKVMCHIQFCGVGLGHKKKSMKFHWTSESFEDA